MMPLFDKWKTFLEAHGTTERPVISYTELLNRYSEPQRYYHTFFGHIVMVMNEFEAVRNLCINPLVVEGALYTHDAVYDSRKKDSEEQSAEWMRQIFGKLGISQTYCEAVADLIVDASKTHIGIPRDVDRNIFISLDLSILGRPWPEYEVYMKNVGREYAWVDIAFGIGTRAKKRSEFLENFLTRNPIFPHEYFSEKYEKQARENLSREIELLRSALNRG